MGPQAGEVVALEKLRIANLNRISKMPRQPLQKRIEPLYKLARAGECAPSESPEFKNQRRDLLPVWIERPQKSFPQQMLIEKGRVLQPALSAVARMRRKHFTGDLFGNLEGESKPRRGLCEQALPESIGRKLVKSEIPADSREDLTVFAKALGLEHPLREVAPGQV